MPRIRCALGLHDWRKEWEGSWDEYTRLRHGTPLVRVSPPSGPPPPPPYPPPSISGSGSIVGVRYDRCHRCLSVRRQYVTTPVVSYIEKELTAILENAKSDK